LKTKSPRAARTSRQSFEPRLRAYSTLSAAALATAGAAAVSTASGQIVNFDSAFFGGTFPTVTVPGGPGYATNRFGINPPGFTGSPIVLQAVHFSFASGSFHVSYRSAVLKASRGSIALIGSGSFSRPKAKKFNRGDPINGAPFWSPVGGLVAKHSSGNFLTGNFQTNVPGYAGFRLSKNAHYYYGWLRVDVNGSGTPNSLQLVDTGTPGIAGAFNTSPSGAITAGQTASAIPEPANVAAGLGLLALGAAGVREMRRRRTVAA